MKAEKRKELERNALVERLSRMFQALKDRPNNGTFIFWGCVLLVVVLFVGWKLISRKRSVPASATQSEPKYETLARRSWPRKNASFQKK